ncbi:F0F1 ATP synthase subunit A [Panacibacter ginsenosidivorans]|uniref:ATP synthase subunit a n=1 Tax=Panacibacter ginsenosidivorans TaxID=1813871 RepID=A0A5B8V7L5_9BACT|nr:F0F1 ATP synthase subunit A [Panacibacter ginsenosidivorans]QEC67520.1 F0F1 ATP synthase subunit A [Panacibacter ginsenosidivorans]
MISKRVKCLLVAVFSLIFTHFTAPLIAQENNDEAAKSGANHEKKKEAFDAQEVIFGHVLNAHEFHFLDLPSGPVTIPLPVILYSPERGFTSFMSSKFEHGHATYEGYKLEDGNVVAVDANGNIDETVKVYDLSLTRNVVQMILALIILVWIMLTIAKRYKAGQGVTSAPKGMQNLMEPVITFIRDEVAKPNLGNKYERYFPYLLTVFFFILINNVFGLIPGTANVTGNIAFTIVLGVISFIVIMFSANKHYWAHIFNPPVPGGIKAIMIPVEILGIFTKPFALIIRLFANMLAGHIIIICLISLIFIFANISTGIGWGFSPVSIAFSTFIYLIEVLVAFIQAFIFTNLTAVFIGQAIEETHGNDHHQDHHVEGEKVTTAAYDDAVIA